MNKALALSILGCLGVGTTGALAVNAGIEYQKMKESNDYIDKNDIIKTFAPPVVSGALTVGCILGSNYISSKQIAGATAAIGVIGAKSREYLEELKKRHPNVYNEIKNEIHERHAKEAMMRDFKNSNNDNKKCYYSYWCDQMFFAEPYDILQAEADLNKYLSNSYEASLYDYFANFPKECDIQLKDWMKYVGWWDGDTSYRYNAGYFGNYVNTAYIEKPEYTILEFEILPDYSPELTEDEINCVEAAMMTGTDI